MEYQASSLYVPPSVSRYSRNTVLARGCTWMTLVVAREECHYRRMGGGVLLVGNFLSAATGAFTVGEELAIRLRELGRPVIATSRQPRRVVRLLDMVATTVIRRHEYGVAHVDVYSGPAFLYAEAVCAVLRLLRKPYVLTLHGGELPEFGRRWPVRVRTLLRGAAVVTTPSRYLLEQMQPYRASLQVLPNAVDAGVHMFRPRERPQPRLLWLRAFHRIYNPALAPAVVARLVAEFPEIRLTMIGPDKGDGTFQETVQRASRLRVGDRVTFPGAVAKAQVPAWLDTGDIFLNCASVDNAPVSVVEAMASGLCVISTRVGGIPYLLEDERNALLVPPDDPDAMAGAVRRVLNEPGLAAMLSRNARAKAEQLDWVAILPQWNALLSMVSEKGTS